MKKLIFTFSVAVFICMNGSAKVWTVSHDAATPAQYANITSAIKAASKGDTIYINGSNSSYPGFTVNKPNLTFIGAGANPTKDNPYPTYIDSSMAPNYGNIWLDTSATSGSGRGAKFIGMVINEIVDGTNWTTLGYTAATSKNQDISISRCTINYIDFCGDFWTVSNCVIYGWVDIENHSNSVISNNIFTVNGYVEGSNQNTVLISNNLFWLSSNPLNSSISNMTFSNNMLIGTDMTTGNQSSIVSNIESNNLTYHVFGGYGGENLPLGSNSGSGNLTNVDPLFNLELTLANNQILTSTSITILKSVVGGNITILNPALDFNLQVGSPALTASSGGGPIGIYGGAYPWVDASGMGPIPFVEHMGVTSVVQQGGNINVTATGKTHN